MVPSARPGGRWGAGLAWLPVVVMVGWWLRDLSFQWASLVEYRFGWMVLVLAVFLGWERWPNRPRDDRPAPLAISLALAGLGLPCVLLAELYKIGVARVPSSSFLLSVGTFLFLAAGVLQAAGPRTFRHFLFPLLFFLVAVPLPKLLWNPVVLGLQGLITRLNVEALNLLGIPAQQFGNVIQLPNTQVGVDEACSGVRSLQSSVMAGLFVGDLMLRRPGWKVVFLGAGVALAIVGNFGRALSLALAAHRGGSSALDAIHDTAGWSVLAFTAAGVALLAWWFSRLEQRALARSAPGAGAGGVADAAGRGVASSSGPEGPSGGAS